MSPKMLRSPRWSLLAAKLVLPLAVGWFVLRWCTPTPALTVEMSSTAASYAQVFWDTGAGMSAAQSETTPVRASSAPVLLRLPLPNALVSKLRFDPVALPATVLIRRVAILRSDGSTAAVVEPARIRGVLGFDQMDLFPGGVRYRVRSDSYDPQLVFDLTAPLDLRSRFPGALVLLFVAVCAIATYFLESLAIIAVRRASLGDSAALATHLIATAALYWLALPLPSLVVEMSSTVYSRAQVYYDAGEGLSEGASSSLPVRPSTEPQTLRLVLPRARMKYLRFDPLIDPGTIVIRRVELVRPDGSVALAFPPERVIGILGFDQMDIFGGGVRYHVRSDSYDPELVLQMDGPVDLRSYRPGLGLIAKLAILNLLLGALLWGRGRRAAFQRLRRIDNWVAARAIPDGFLKVDRLAIWFYAGCVVFCIVMSALNLNGSSMGVLWKNYKEGAPAHIVAGTPQDIRADEFNYVTPSILNQIFRARKFATEESVFGNHSAALTGEIPVRHYTTLVRPQYWPFFLFRADYAFSTWWQLKQLIFTTGVFTLLLLLTRSSGLAVAGTAWLFFSQLSQWDYSWPSMLPEMGGTFCFVLVLAFYLTVGTRRIPLLLSAVACAAGAVNFAMFFYVPHLVPYVWIGTLLFLAWCIGHRAEIVRPEGGKNRLLAAFVCVALIALFMIPLLREMRELIAGIAATNYPGKRINSGGLYTWAHYGSHFLAPFESMTHFPPQFYNINEASGFLWLAPATLFCIAKMRALPRQRQWLLGALWGAGLLLLAWLSLPVPQWLGHFLFLDRVMSIRCLPALGLANTAIVMLVLSSKNSSRRFPLWGKFASAVPFALLCLTGMNRDIGSFFTAPQIGIGALWAGALAALLIDGSRKWFAAAVVIPNALLFGMINPIQRGIDTITSSTLFEKMQKDRRLLEGKWMVFGADMTASPFVAVGCRTFNGSKQLPDIDNFPLLERHGVDTNVLNNLSYIDAAELPPGQPPKAAQGKYGVFLSISPLDPLVRELGIQFLAFHRLPSEEVRAHLKPVAPGSLSEFFLYEFK